ncbi:MAG: pyridoxamine 5'-phosphate oxidase family protein [Deltaproteobacteria bacterium]|nr:pyridoxamine 5'-phosphate oxidase family protein [Deltaproteobacteria bacterium]
MISMPKLEDAERDGFLAERGLIMHIATVSADGAPLVAPIWFAFEKGRIWFTPRQHSEWLKNLRDDRRVALSIDESVLPYRKVVVRGRANIDYEIGQDDIWRDLYRRIANRYLPSDAADGYIDGTDDQPRALCSIILADAELRTWRMSVDDEPADGVWAKRYWTDDAKINS